MCSIMIGPSQRFGPVLSFSDWIDAVRFRWWMVLAAMGAALLLAFAYLLIAPRTYAAISSLLFDVRGPDPLRDAKTDDPQANSRAMIATQVDLIKAPSLIDAAARQSNMTNDARLITTWRATTGGRVPYRDWLRARIVNALDIAPGKDSNVLQIQAKAGNPVEAAQIANGIAKAAVEEQYRLRTVQAKAYADWLANRVEGARADVIGSQNELRAFVQSTGIVNDGDTSSEGTQLADVTTQLAAAEARAAATRGSSYSGSQGRGDAERSETIQGLRSQVAAANAKLANLRATFGPEYPEVKSAQAELTELRSHLDRAVSTTTSAFSQARSAQAASEREAANASENRLQRLASRQRERVASISANLAQYQRLKNEFTAKQRNFTDLYDRFERMKLQGSVPQTEIQILDLASAPLLPVAPRPLVVLVLALMLGFILSALVAILLESMHPRVRGLAQLERLFDVPMLGTLTLPKSGGQMLLLTGESR